MPITIDFKRIEEKEETIYKAVVMAAKRANQIHKKVNDDLKKQLGEVENEVENEEDLDEEIVDREKIVKEFDSMDKPSVLAMQEYLDDKLHIKKDEE